MSAPLSPTIIITSHGNPDFDALASMVAAGKLYPEAVIIAPPYKENKKTSCFEDDIAALFHFHQPRDCDLSGTRMLVVTDTRQCARIAHVADVLRNPGLEIHVYDHHPASKDDLPASCAVIQEWGSTTTILARILQEKNISLNPDEATMLGLGLYEDTGNFLFNSTTPEDFQVGAWLRGQGMDLNKVADVSNCSMTIGQVLVLNRMLENAMIHEIHGIRIAVTEIVLEEYVEDFASLARQMMSMENVQVVLALGQMGDRVQLVARSQAPDKVNVGKICAAFGGGGHAYAAAAAVKDKTITEIKDTILTMVLSTVDAEINVREKMTAPAKVVRENDTLTSAEAMMLRYGLKAAPVVEAEGMRCLGLLDYQTAARAMAHKLGTQKVADYMYYGAKTLPPSSSLYPAMDIILNQRQRMVPVVDDAGCVLGVLTRTDIMHLLLDASIHITEKSSMPSAQKERCIQGLMKEKLPAAHVEFLTKIGRLADRLSVRVYVVGGFVRDLLLDRINLDIDLTVEGDGIVFARHLAEELRGSMREHPKFQTALVFYEDQDKIKKHIDVATARLEYYEHPGALPTVELSSIKMDLSRRDFTVNALAIRLNTAHFGDLVDPFGAQRDIREKSIRVLHSLSFVDDPTRVLRAIRFEKRFGFRIDPQSEKLIKNCIQLGFLRNLSGSRLFNELKHIFNEKNPLLCLERMDGLGILADIHPQLKLTPAKIELISSTEDVLSWYTLLYLDENPVTWIVYLLSLCPHAKYPEMAEVLNRFNLPAKIGAEFLQLREATRKVAKELDQWQKTIEKNLRELYIILAGLSLEGILHIMAQNRCQDIKKEISLFLSKLRQTQLDINGRDLLNMGAESGPGIGLVLRLVREAKAGGEAETREAQLILAQNLLAQHELISLEQISLDEIVAGRT